MSKTAKVDAVGSQEVQDIVQPPASIFNDPIGPGADLADLGGVATDTRLYEEERRQDAYWRALEGGVQTSKRCKEGAPGQIGWELEAKGPRAGLGSLTETAGLIGLSETRSNAPVNDYENKFEQRGMPRSVDHSAMPLKSVTPRQSIGHLQQQQQLHEYAAQSDTRRRSKLAAQSINVCEPIVQKAVQSIQILPAERPKPQYVYISDHEGKLIEIDRNQLEMLRTAVAPAMEASKRVAKDVNARENCSDTRGNGNGIGEAATGEEDDDQSQNETKSQITQFTDNTGANQYCYFPSQQFQMNQVRCFQNMNAADSHSQLNSSDKPPLVASFLPAQAANYHPGRNLGTVPSHNTQEQAATGTHQPHPSAHSAMPSLAPHTLANADSPCRAAPAPPRSTRLSTTLHALNSQYTAAVLPSTQQHSREQAPDGHELAEESGGVGTRKRRAEKEEGERPCWLTFSNNVFDVVAEKQQTASFTQSLKSAEMESAGLGKEPAVLEGGEQPPLLEESQQAAEIESGTGVKKVRELLNGDRLGQLAGGRAKSSQLGQAGTATPQRGKIVAAQRNNMKSTREDSGVKAHGQGSLIRSSQQLSSAGAKSPLYDAGTESSLGSALLKKRRELGLGATSSSRNQRKLAQSYNQHGQVIATRKAAYTSSPMAVDLPYRSNEKTESRLRAAYKGQQSHAAMRQQPREQDRDGTQLASNLANPSIISHHKQSSVHRLLAEKGNEVSGAIGSRERRQETENGEFDALEEPQEEAMPPKITEDEMRKEMIAAFQKMRLDVYSDILRIKKPQTQALLAAQLLCRLVCAFRGGAQRQVTDTKFPEWSQIQEFVHKKPNVIKFNQEITQLIQHMILSRDYVIQVKSDQLKNHLSKMTKLHQQYFGSKTKTQVLRPFQTNKNFSQIVHLCYCIVRYVLFQAGREDLLNLAVEQPPGQGGRAQSRKQRQEREQSDRDTSLGSRQSQGRLTSLGKPAHAPPSAAASAYKQARDRSVCASLERGVLRQGQWVSSKKPKVSQSRNVAAALGSSREASHSTALSAKASSLHQLCFGMTKKRSPRQTLQQREQDKGNDAHERLLQNRMSTPKQEQYQPQSHVGNSKVHAGHKSQQQPSAPGKSSVQRASNQQLQKSAEYPQKRVAYARALEYEDEVKRRLHIATVKHSENTTTSGAGCAFRTAGAGGRQTKKARQANRQEGHAANLSRSHRAGGGTLAEKQRSVASRKMAAAGETSVSSQNRLSFKADSVSASFTKPSHQTHDQRQQPPRLSSPHEAYQQPKDRQIQTQSHSNYRYNSKATEKSSGEPCSIQNVWVNILKRKSSQNDGHPGKSSSAYRNAGSALKSYLNTSQIKEKQYLQAAPLNEPDLVAGSSSPLLVSQKKAKNVYEIMLQQQRRKSNNKYEKLTLSSVQKSKRGFNPVGEFSGRKATAPLVQTFTAASGTAGLASTLYNSNVFASTLSRQNGKENQQQVRIAAEKAEEQRSESKPRLHDKLAIGLASRIERAQGLINGIGKGVLSPHGTRASPDKGSLKRHRPSAGAILSPPGAVSAPHYRKEPATISREEGSQQPYGKTATPKHHKGMSKSRVESQINQLIERAKDMGPIVNDFGMSHELLQRTMGPNIAEQPLESNPSLAASSSAKPRKSRLERSLSKSHRRRDRLQRLRPELVAPDPNPDFSQTVGLGDEQLRQFLEIEEKCENGEAKTGAASRREVEPDSSRFDFDKSKPSEIIEPSANLTQIFYPQMEPSESNEYTSGADVCHGYAESGDPPPLSSIIQQIQPMPPAPVRHPTEPDEYSQGPPLEELDRFQPIEQVPEANGGHAQQSIMILEQGVARSSRQIDDSARGQYNVHECTSPTNYKGAGKDSDELSNLSHVGGHADDGGAMPAVHPQSSSRESGRISELHDSESSDRSPLERKDEHALSSESLLTEEQADGLDAPKSLKDSARVQEYRLTGRSSHQVKQIQYEQQEEATVDGDPFEAARRIAAMIKADCLDRALLEGEFQPTQHYDGTIDDSDQKQQPELGASAAFRCTPPNELSARNLLQRERVKNDEQRLQEEDPRHPRERKHDQVERMMVPEQSHSQRQLPRQQTQQESTWTISTPMRPARVQPRDCLSPSSKGTPATQRHGPQGLNPRPSLPEDHSATLGRRPELAIATAAFPGSRLDHGQPEPDTAVTTHNERGDNQIAETLGSTAAGAKLHSFLEYCGRSADPRESQKGPIRVDQVITHAGHLQRVELGGDDEEDEGIARSGRVTLGEREPPSAGRRSLENLSELSEEEPEDQHQGAKIAQEDPCQDGDRVEPYQEAGEAKGEEVQELDEAAYKSKSAGSEDGYYMQEIVSPFRQLKLSALESGGAAGCNEPSEALEEQHRQIESTSWIINPVKVKRREHQNDDEDHYLNHSYYDAEEEQRQLENQLLQGRGSTAHILSLAFSKQQSHGSNPYIQPRELDTSELALEKRTSSPVVISPGKMKEQISISRSSIMEQILATQQEIEQNSPSKTDGVAAHIDRDMIQRLKERRLLQRSKSREGPSGQPQPGESATPTEESDPQPPPSLAQNTNELIREIQDRLQTRQIRQ